jgi:hypothetical protein
MVCSKDGGEVTVQWYTASDCDIEFSERESCDLVEDTKQLSRPACCFETQVAIEESADTLADMSIFRMTLESAKQFTASKCNIKDFREGGGICPFVNVPTARADQAIRVQRWTFRVDPYSWPSNLGYSRGSAGMDAACKLLGLPQALILSVAVNGHHLNVAVKGSSRVLRQHAFQIASAAAGVAGQVHTDKLCVRPTPRARPACILHASLADGIASQLPDLATATTTTSSTAPGSRKRLTTPPHKLSTQSTHIRPRTVTSPQTQPAVEPTKPKTWQTRVEAWWGKLNKDKKVSLEAFLIVAAAIVVYSLYVIIKHRQVWMCDCCYQPWARWRRATISDSTPIIDGRPAEHVSNNPAFEDQIYENDEAEVEQDVPLVASDSDPRVHEL